VAIKIKILSICSTGNFRDELKLLSASLNYCQDQDSWKDFLNLSLSLLHVSITVYFDY